MTIAIQGVGVVGGFGSGLESLSVALSNKGPHIQRVQVKTSNGPCEMPAYLADTSRLDDFLNNEAANVGLADFRRVLRRYHHGVDALGFIVLVFHGYLALAVRAEPIDFLVFSGQGEPAQNLMR